MTHLVSSDALEFSHAMPLMMTVMLIISLHHCCAGLGISSRKELVQLLESCMPAIQKMQQAAHSFLQDTGEPDPAKASASSSPFLASI